MEDVIYLVQDGNLVEMTAQRYESEPMLQVLLAKYPHLLAGGQMNPDNPRRWLLIAREMGIAWEEGGGDQLSLDHLFLDQEGIPTLVEVKRSTDTRIRREVVGQMLEYAANAVVYWPVEKIRARFELRCKNENIGPAEALADLIGNNDDGEADQEQFWQQVHTNLQAGRIRMVFVADEIPFQLRRIVEFLNKQLSTAEVLAVEVKQYKGQGLQTLVPRLIGQITHPLPINPPKQWDEASFFEGLAKRNQPTEVAVARHILDWAKVNMPEVWYGSGKRSGSLNLRTMEKGRWHQLIGLWTSGYIEFKFEYMKAPNTLNDVQRLSFLKRINHTFGSSLADEAIHSRPSLAMASLAQPDVLEAFLNDLEWALAEIKSGLSFDNQFQLLSAMK